MRLVCPNCEAKYEVPEDAIPETGRDVQCANCGHAWYQMRARTPVAEPLAAPPAAPPAPAAVAAPAPASAPAPAAAAERVEVAAPAPEPVPEPAPEPVAHDAAPEPLVSSSADATKAGPEIEARAASAEPEPDTASSAEAEVEQSAPKPVVEAERPVEVVPAEEPAPVTAETAPEADPEPEEEPVAPPAAAAAAGAAAYAVDDSVLAILREEAEREAKARQAEAARPLETQTELGIEQAVPEVNLPHQPVYEDAALAARRSRLPDVEEINSTLRPSERVIEDEAPAAVPVAAEGRSSFRSGFLMVLTLAILGSAVYGSADAIATAVPSLAGPLESYVGFVDSLRLQLDGLMQSATVAINGT